MSPSDRTHASFFSGVGGLDMGLERAGWRTVSFSEIDPYASAVLAERWPGVPNLGDIVALRAEDAELRIDGWNAGVVGVPPWTGGRIAAGARTAGVESAGIIGRVESWHGADLWTGGFPCQDLSVAGKRRGLAGARSGLAFAFLDLVERHRPPAVLLENVPGLLSSHAGRDFGTLLATLGQLGYGWAYRVLDARHFGVPQRRRRVFILGIHARLDPAGTGAAEVLSVGTRCPRHPATGHEAGPGASGSVADGATTARTVQSAFGHHGWTLGAQDVDGGLLQVANGLRASDGHHGHGSPRGDGGDNLVVSGTGAGWWTDDQSAAGTLRSNPGGTPARVVVRPSPDAGRDRAPDGLAGRLDDRGGVAATLNSGGNSGGFRAEPGEHLVAVAFDRYNGVESDLSPTLPSGFEGGFNHVFARVGPEAHPARPPMDRGREAVAVPDVLLPLGLDSHRYRCCGNGVVSDVSEWIGLRLSSWMDALSEQAA